MTEYFSEKCDQDYFHIASIKYISNLNKNCNNYNQSNKSEHEKFIAMNLDNVLEKREDLMSEISIQSLYNIFYHKDRVLNNHQLALDFINKNKVKNPEFSILLPSLDAEKINEENVVESLSKTEENFGFIPKLAQSFVCSYYEQNQDYQKVLNRLTGNFLNDHNYDLVKSILCEKCFDVNSKIIYEDDKTKFEVTPLCAAIEINDIDLIKNLLVRPKIDVNMKSIFEDKKGSRDETFQLFDDDEEKVIFDEADVKEITPLHFAIEKENIEIIKILLNNPGIDVNIKSIIEKGRKALAHIEMSSQAIKLLKSLIQSPESIIKSKENLNKSYKEVNDREEITLLNFAIEKENIDIINILLKHPQIDINIESVTFENYILAKVGDKKIMNGSEPFSKKENALHLAIEKENIEIIKSLLEHQKIDINIKSIKYSVNYTLSLLVFGFGAAKMNQIQSLGLLGELSIPLDKEVCIFVEGKEEKTALHLAIDKGNIEIIKLILSYSKLNINDKATTESYIKCTLSESEKLEIQEKIPILLECIFNYINTNPKNEKKEHTALHIAVEKEDIQIIKALLKNKNIDIEATDELGNKPINLTNNQEIKDLLK